MLADTDAGHYLHFQYRESDSTLDSYYYLFAVGDYTVKVRITHKEGEATIEEAREFVTGLLHALDGTTSE